MRTHRTRTALVSLTLFALALLATAAEAAMLPLRSGTVISREDSGVFSYIKAVDAAGKEFWVVTAICTIGDKGKIDVLAGAHYDKLKLEPSGQILEDVYTAQLIKVGDLEIPGFAAHGLPPGCVQMQ